MNALAVLPLFNLTDRVLAQPLSPAQHPWNQGGPGQVVGLEPIGGGDFFYDVLLDGTSRTVLYLARQLKKEPTI